MKLTHRLLALPFGLAAMIWLVGLVALSQARMALHRSVQESSAQTVATAANNIQRELRAALDDWRVYTVSSGIRQAVEASNKEFEAMPNREKYIDEQDKAWQEQPKDSVSPFMKAIFDNATSADLKNHLAALKAAYGYDVFGEAFVTNKYGANVGQSDRTSDYRQSDEGWWKDTAANGWQVGDVDFDDSSGIYSADVSVAVTDAQNQVIGVTKAPYNIQGVFNQIAGAI